MKQSGFITLDKEELSSDNVTIGIFAILLSNLIGYNITKEDLIERLKRKKYLMSSQFCEPYQKYIEREWFAVKEVRITRDNTQNNIIKVFVSEKGQKRIVDLLRSGNL